jgi:LysR family transcriptional regulator of beta-lactamase
MDADRLFDAPLSPLCAPVVGARLNGPGDLLRETLLRSYRSDEWPRWFAAAGLGAPPIRGTVFDSSWMMVETAIQGQGVALAPPRMFVRQLEDGRLCRPFALAVPVGAYWLTRLKSRPVTPALRAFRAWILDSGGTDLLGDLLGDPVSGVP